MYINRLGSLGSPVLVFLSIVSIHLFQRDLDTGKNKFFLRKTGGNQLSIKVLLKMENTEQYVEAKALIDSGCTGCAINREFVNKHKIKREKLSRQLRVLNADGSENSSGRITHHTEIMMRMGKIHWEKMDFGITKLDDHDIFLGFDWLMEHNPEINWKTGGIRFSRCPDKCKEMEKF